MARQARVLLICSDDAKSSVLEGILGDHTALTTVRTLSDFERSLDNGEYDAIFCSWSFHEGTWRDALEQVHRRDPSLPLVVFCHSGSEREWTEALRAGVFDLLVAPYWQRTVLAVLEHALQEVRRSGRPSRTA